MKEIFRISRLLNISSRNAILVLFLILISSFCRALNNEKTHGEEIFAAELDGPVILIDDYDHYPKTSDLKINLKTIGIGSVDSGDTKEVSHILRNVSQEALLISHLMSSSSWVKFEFKDENTDIVKVEPGKEIPINFIIKTPPDVYREKEAGSKLRQTDISFNVTNATRTFRLTLQVFYAVKARFWVDPLPVVVAQPIPGDPPKPFIVNVFIKEDFAPFIRSIDFDPPTIGLGNFQLGSIPEGVQLAPSKEGTIWKYSFYLYVISTDLKTTGQREPVMKILFDLSRHYRIHIPIAIINSNQRQ